MYGLKSSLMDHGNDLTRHVLKAVGSMIKDSMNVQETKADGENSYHMSIL